MSHAFNYCSMVSKQRRTRQAAGGVEVVHKPPVIWASLSEPHTSELNGRFFIYYIYYICRTSFRKCKLTLLTRNIPHPKFKCGRNKRTLGQSITLPYSSLEPCFTFIVLGYTFCYPWIPIPVLEKLSS